MNIKDITTPTILSYHGGGYDGCVFEWNFSYYNGEVWNHFISTGCLGAKTDEDLQKRIQGTHDVYKIPEDWDKLLRHESKLSILLISHHLKELNMGVYIPCDICSQNIGDTHFEVGWHGIGGIMSSPNEIICQDCYATYTCCECGEYYGPDHIFDNQHCCEYCSSDRDI